MADEMTNNGVASDNGDRTVAITGNEDREDVFVDFDESDTKTSGLLQKIEAIEREKQELVRENEVVRERIEKLKQEIARSESDKAEFKIEIERSGADEKALGSIAARAAELETEVSRLQHDLITAIAEGEEASKEVSELKKLVEELKKSDSEKGLKLDVLEKERNVLLKHLDKEAEGMKEAAGMKEAEGMTESRIHELEKKLEALEGRESLEKTKIEQAAKVKIDEKDAEIRKLKKWVEDLEALLRKEREEMEIVKNDLEALLKKSERKGKEMENKLAQLHKELEASEQMISGLKNKALEGVNGKDVVVDGDFIEDGEKGLMGLKLQWPVVAASTGAIAAVAALYYLRCARQR